MGFAETSVQKSWQSATVAVDKFLPRLSIVFVDSVGKDVSIGRISTNTTEVERREYKDREHYPALNLSAFESHWPSIDMNARSVDQLSTQLSQKSIQLDRLGDQLSRATVDLEKATKETSSLRRELAAKTNQVSKLSDQVDRLTKDLKQKEYAVSSLQEQVSRKDTKGSTGSGPSDRSLASPISRRTSTSSLSSPGSGGLGLGVGMTVDVISNPSVVALMKQVEDLKREVESVTSQRGTGVPGAAGRSPMGGIGGIGGIGGGRPNAVDVSRINKLNDEIATWKDRAESLMAEVQTSKRKLAAMESEASNARGLADSMSQAKIKAEAQYRAAREEIMQLRAVAEQNSSQLRSDLKHSEAVAARHASDADTVSTHAESLQRRVAALAVERDAMERAKNDAMGLANQAKEAARGAILEKDAMAKKLDEKVVALARLQAQFVSMESSRRTSDAQFEALCAKLNAAHSAAKMNEANAAVMAGQASNAESDVAQMMARLRATQERCDAAELSIEALRAQLEGAQEALKVKTEEHADVVAALDEATEKMSAMSVGGEETSARKNAALSANAVLEEKVGRLSGEVERKEAAIRDMAKEMEVLECELQDARDKLAAQDLVLQNSDVALNTIKSRARAADDGHASTAEDMANDLDAARERAEEAAQALREAQLLQVNAAEAAKRAEDALRAKTNELDEAREHLNAETERADALSGLLESREEDLKGIRQELAEAKALAMQAGDLSEEGTGMSNRLDVVHGQLASAMDEIGDLRVDLNAKQQELDGSLAKRKDSERKIEALEAAIADRSAQIEDLRSSLEESEDRLSSIEERAIQAEMRAADAKSMARDFEMSAEDAKRELERVQAQLDVAREAVDDVHDLDGAGAAALDDSITERTETLVRKLKEDLIHVERLLEESEAKCKTLEDEVRLEKRRGMAAAMKAGVAVAVAVPPTEGKDVEEAFERDAERDVEEAVEEAVERDVERDVKEAVEEAVEEAIEEAIDEAIDAGAVKAEDGAGDDETDPVRDLVANIFSKFDS